MSHIFINRFLLNLWTAGPKNYLKRFLTTKKIKMKKKRNLLCLCSPLRTRKIFCLNSTWNFFEALLLSFSTSVLFDVNTTWMDLFGNICYTTKHQRKRKYLPCVLWATPGHMSPEFLLAVACAWFTAMVSKSISDFTKLSQILFYP